MLKKPISAPRCFGIGRDLQQGFGAGAEQQIVEHVWLCSASAIQLMRQREHDMEVAVRRAVPARVREPAFARLRLALRAVPVAAGVVGDGADGRTAGQDRYGRRARRCGSARWRGSLELLKVEAQFGICSRKRLPCARRMSATSTVGRLILVVVGR